MQYAVKPSKQLLARLLNVTIVINGEVSHLHSYTLTSSFRCSSIGVGGGGDGGTDGVAAFSPATEPTGDWESSPRATWLR